MKTTYATLVIGVLALTAGCKNFLDVNTNPNGPQLVSANVYLPPMLHWMVTSPQFDGRFVGHYAQEWYSTSTSTSPAQTWGKMGYDAGSDNGAQQWRDVYWSLGQNLIDMNTKAEAEQRWDLLGVGMILKAWGWQVLTDLHGEIIVKEAIDASRTTFDYDTQQYAYEEVQRLLDSAIVLLKRTDGAVDRGFLAGGDHMYGGDRTKWLKLAFGMLALNLIHYSNKAEYDPARVIALIDSSFTSNSDDALLAYPCTTTDFQDCNFWGRTRNNITLYRQTRFAVGLMDGTQFGGTVDPRMSRMLTLDSANVASASPSDDAIVEPVLIRPYLPIQAPPGTPLDSLGVLELWINTHGNVESVHLKSPGNRYRERWWVFTAKSWQFQPATKNGKPIRFLKRIPLTDLNVLEPQ